MDSKTDNTLDKTGKMHGLSRKIKILGIAPYEGMQTIMIKLAGERDDILLDVFVGDMNRGTEIYHQNSTRDYDVIISRGGTAELIRQETQIPVVEVNLSFYDLLRTIKLAENYSGRYAIVAFSSITDNARLLCDLLKYKIDIFTIHSQSEVQECLLDLKQKGYQMVLCDMIAYTTAKHIGLNAILFTSGAESISAAFDEAVKITADYDLLQSEKQFYKEILRNENDSILVLKENGDIFFSNLEGDPLPDLLQTLADEIPSILSKGTQKFFKNLNGALYSFTCKKLTFLSDNYVAFYFSQSSVPFVTSKYGIQYSNLQEEEDQFFDSFYSITNVDTNVRASIDSIAQISSPVMLSGEAGSGEEQVARLIYSQSQLNKNPLIIVNCSLLNDRSWNFLINHYNSPFNDNDNTIYLEDITALSESRRCHLLSVIIDTNLCHRNRVIFSCTCPMGQGIPAEAKEFVNLLSCVMLRLPPLRENTDKIPTLAVLYLSTMNTSSENPIIGLDEDAVNILQSYSWPYNYAQFKRILSELSLIGSSPYIHADEVNSLLKKEEEPVRANAPQSSGGGSCYMLDLSRPLNEITKDIIQLVLSESNGNQSAAAKRLEIGRSTIWRYLKE